MPRVSLKHAFRNLVRLEAMSTSPNADKVHRDHAISPAAEKVCWRTLSKAVGEVSNWQDGGHANGRSNPSCQIKRLVLSCPRSLIRIILTRFSWSIVIT